jgi:fucose 4-O-acetylase-like acetyltransferase
MAVNSISTTLHRDLSLDIFRAFGIFCMIVGHINFGVKVDHFIHAFHMPLFFFVSGIFFNSKKSFESFMINKTKKILIPYFSFATFYYVVWLIADSSNSLWYFPLKYLLWNNSVGAGSGMPYAGALWFLTAFFVANIIYFGIRVFVKYSSLQFITVLLCVLIGTLLPLVLQFRLPYTIDAGMIGVGFMYCGYLFKKSNQYEKLTNLSLPILIFMSVALVLLVFFNGYVNMRMGTYSNVILFWINALGCIIVGINLCKLVAYKMEKLSYPILSYHG